MSEHDSARYIYCSDPSKADEMQGAFLDLSYADGSPDRPDRWFSEVRKWDDPGQVRVCIKTTDQFWIRVDAPTDVFDALLQPYIDQGLMPQSDLDQVHERIRVFAGTGASVSIYNMLPTIIRSYAWTYQDLIDNGWIEPED